MEAQGTEIAQYQQEAGVLKVNALALPITNDEEVVVASGTIKALAIRLGQYRDFFKPMVDKAFATHKEICKGRNLVCDPLEEATKILNTRVASYQWKQQQERDKEEKRQKDIAEAKEKKEKDKLKEQAKVATPVRAAEIRQQIREVYVAPKIVAPIVKTGTSVRFFYDVEVLNASRVPEQYKVVDVAKLKRLKGIDEALDVPGVKFIKRAIGSTRRA